MMCASGYYLMVIIFYIKQVEVMFLKWKKISSIVLAAGKR